MVEKSYFSHLNLCMVNAFILYNEWCKRECKPKIKQLLFHRNVIKQIITQTGVNIPSVPQRSHQHLQLIERHFPSSIPLSGKWRNVLGLAKRKRPGHESSYECAKCSVSLCVTPCFEMYHTYLDYENAYIVWQRSKNVDDILSIS